MYGDTLVLKKYCGKLAGNLLNNQQVYQHFWVGEEFNIHPEIVIGTNGLASTQKQVLQLVYRRDQEAFLRESGFKNVKAIGCPLIYLEKPKDVQKIKSSLLVVPNHTLPDSHERIDEEKFCEKICKYLDKFEKVSFLLHKTCIEMDLWTKTLEKHGFSYEIGAGHFDETSYFRLCEIFSRYEWILSDYLSSHVPFASYFGAKVCLIDDYHETKIEDIKSLSFCKGAGVAVLQLSLNLRSREYVKKNYQFLFNNCESNYNFKEWADHELGVDNKKSPEEIQKIFGWSRFGQIKLRLWLSFRYFRFSINFCLRFLIMVIKIGPTNAIKFMKEFQTKDGNKIKLSVKRNKSIIYYPSDRNRKRIKKILNIP